jgi:hypothetical protein
MLSRFFIGPVINEALSHHGLARCDDLQRVFVA